MDAKTLAAVCNKIYQRFPDLKGAQPKIQSYDGQRSLLIFKGSGVTADGHAIQRTVRVVVGPDGKIGKVTTSR